MKSGTGKASYGPIDMFETWLSFSEPEGRLRKLIKWHERIIEPASFDEGAIECGSKRDARAKALFSLAFALYEIELFRPIAFKRFDFAGGDELVERGWRLLSPLFPVLAKATETLGLKEGELKWLSLSALALSACHRPGITQKNDSAVLPFVSRVEERIKTEVLPAKFDFDCQAKPGAPLSSSLIILKDELEGNRRLLPPSFLPRHLMLVEGPTEALLMPRFAQCLGESMSERGIYLISSGGANQVVKRYLYWRELVNIGITCVLDRDAGDLVGILKDSMRPADQICVLSEGEIEDAFALPVFVELLNSYLASLAGINCPTVIESDVLTVDDFKDEKERRRALKRLWKERGLGEFDKVDFARFVSNSLLEAGKVPSDIRKMLAPLSRKRRA